MTKSFNTTQKRFPIKSGKNTVDKIREEPGIHSIENHDKIATLSLGYICPDHRTIFRSAIFSTIFRHRRRSWASTYVLTIHTGIVEFLELPFVDVLIQKRKAIVRQSYVSADRT